MGADGAKVIIVNVYSLCAVGLKRNLWGQIRQWRNANLGGLWCILGDFNNITRPSERVGISQRQQDERIVKEFNEWIADLEVKDVSCVERKYT